MGRPDDGGGDFSGIDPQQLWDLINSIKSHTGADGGASAQPQVNGWMGQANRLGLETQRLTTINKHFSWAQGQLPMLNRRHSLAADEAKENGDFGQGSGMVSAGANSLGNFPTSEAAAKAGKDDAKKFKDGDLSPQEYMKLLQANGADPDYAKAAATEMGETRLQEMEQYASLLDEKNPDAGRYVFANFVATAMRNGVDFKDDDGQENLQLLANLTTYATFPSDVLVNLANQCLAPGNTMYSDQLWKALAADPKAATQFVHDNIDVLPYYMQSDSEHRGGLINPNVKDFAKVIEAGTIPGPGSDVNMAADNTTKLAQYYASHPGDHTHAEIQQVFADDIKYYWPDVQASLTDPAPSPLGPGHVDVANSVWEGFIHESMQDSKATAELLSYSQEMANQLSDSDPNNPEIQNAAGILEGTFGYEATTVYQEKKKDSEDKAKDWQDQVSEQLSTAIETGVEIAFDPGAVVKTVSKAAISDILKTFSGQMVSVSPDDMGKPPSTATWKDDWIQMAHQQYLQNNNLGSPQQYANMYTGGKPFLDNKGFLVDNATPAQKQAYNEWLKDPAVANALDKSFLNRNGARLGSLTGTH